MKLYTKAYLQEYRNSKFVLLIKIFPKFSICYGRSWRLWWLWLWNLEVWNLMSKSQTCLNKYKSSMVISTNSTVNSLDREAMTSHDLIYEAIMSSATTISVQNCIIFSEKENQFLKHQFLLCVLSQQQSQNKKAVTPMLKP